MACATCNTHGHIAQHCPSGRRNFSSVPNSFTRVEEFMSYAPFDVTITVTRESACVDAWLRRYPAMVYGMDVEWRPTFRKGEYSSPAVLQLATQQVCLIVQLVFLDHFPESLKDILRHPRVGLAGVGIHEDSKKLQEDYGFACDGLVDLGSLAKNNIHEDGLKTGLKALAKRIFRVDMEKGAQMSDWEVDILSEGQIRYAALDAWMCSELHTAFLHGNFC